MRAAASQIETPKHQSGVASADLRNLRSQQSLLKRYLGYVLIVIAVADAGRYADPDLWWHILSGAHALRTGHFLMRETFSYSAPNHPWIDHERIAELILTWFYTIGGVVGLKLLKLVCTASTIIFIALALAETDAGISIQMAVIMGIAIGLGPEIQFRPQLFSFVAFSLLIFVLTRSNKRLARVRLWPLIVLFGAWANLHGGYIAGLGALGVFGMATVLSGLRRDLHSSLVTASESAALLLASCAASLLTPFGLNNWRAIVRTLANPATHYVIQEWRPMIPVMLERIHQSPSTVVLYAVVLFMMVGTIVSAVLRPRIDDLPLLAIALVFIIFAFYTIRNLEFALIALAPTLAHHAQLLLDPFGENKSTAHEQGSVESGFIRQTAFGGIAFGLLVLTGFFSSRLPAAIPYPSGAIAFMQQHDLSGNVLCNFNWGGYFIYHMTPHSKVFIDNRYDLAYPDSVIRDYLIFWSGRDISRVLDAYPHEFILIPPDSAPALVLRQNSGWKLIYRDPVAMLFTRTTVLTGFTPVQGTASASYFP